MANFSATKIGLAIYIDEYVPNITPKIIAKKTFRISPPNKYIDNKAESSSVIVVLDNVSFIEIFVNS